LAPCAAVARVSCRGYAKKANLDVVLEDKQKPQNFVRMLEEEISVLKTSLEDAESNTVTKDVTDRFLKETQFKYTEDKEEGVIRLTKVKDNFTVEVTFSDSPDDQLSSTPEEEEGEDEEEAEEGEEKEEESEEEEETADESRDHQFTVEIKSTKPGKDKSFLFACFAKSDGSFVVSKLASGDYIPVQIENWSEDLQRELISFLDKFSVNERLSYYIHQLLAQREVDDNIKVLEDFCELVTTK